MNESQRAPVGGIGERTQRLVDAIAAADNPLDATLGLPEQIEPGSFTFTYLVDVWGEGELQAQDIRFDWDGGRTVTWTEDISAEEALSPGSSAPTSGWASWLNGTDLLLAYANADVGFEGWARVPGAAPTSGGDDEDDEEVLADPERWVALARVISVVVVGRQLEGMSGEQFGE